MSDNDNTLQSALDDIREEIDDLVNRVSHIEANIVSIMTSVKGLDTKILALRGQINRVKQGSK